MNTEFLPLSPEHQHSSHAVPRGAREAIPNSTDKNGTDLAAGTSLDNNIDLARGYGSLDEQERGPGPGPAYDPHFTDRVIAATGAGAHPRLARVMPSLVRHLHDFAREVGLARKACTDHGMRIGLDGVQLLGGHGFVKEHPVERWYRDLRAIGVMEGAVLV